MRQAFVVVVVALASFAGGYLTHAPPERLSTIATPHTLDDAALTVPILRENFTVLSCNHSTTIGLEGCAEQRVVALDTTITQLRRDLWPRLLSRRAREHFVTAERAWLVFRRASCTSQANIYEGGSLSVVTFANCLVAEDRQHVSNLRDTISLYQQGETSRG